MTAHLLRTSQIAKAYGPVVALRSVDLTVAPGEMHALLGANGAGKSTMVKILTGVIGHSTPGPSRSMGARSPSPALPLPDRGRGRLRVPGPRACP